MPLVLNGATSGSTTIQATDAVTATLTLPSSTSTLLSTTSSISTSQLSGSITASQLPAGTVKQVSSTTKIDSFTTSGTYNSWVDVTGMSVSITPTSASSKILVLFEIMGASSSNGWVRLVRDSTAISVGTASGSRQAVSSANMTTGNGNVQLQDSGVYLDSPATTSSVTYKLQVITDTGTFYINRTSNDSDNVYTGRGASSITVMEIAA